MTARAASPRWEPRCSRRKDVPEHHPLHLESSRRCISEPPLSAFRGRGAHARPGCLSGEDTLGAGGGGSLARPSVFADGAGRGRPLRPDRQRFVRARGRGSGDRPRGGGEQPHRGRGPLPLPGLSGRNGPCAQQTGRAGRRAPRLSVGGAAASLGRT